MEKIKKVLFVSIVAAVALQRLICKELSTALEMYGSKLCQLQYLTQIFLKKHEKNSSERKISGSGLFLDRSKRGH